MTTKKTVVLLPRAGADQAKFPMELNLVADKTFVYAGYFLSL